MYSTLLRKKYLEVPEGNQNRGQRKWQEIAIYHGHVNNEETDNRQSENTGCGENAETDMVDVDDSAENAETRTKTETLVFHFQ